ncbi:MAG: hypothetical protein JO166_20300 [Deltaproteobacteria bacterium]|nr:hypothetical protein [Deltaproteobacteria bacterium]
MDSKIKLLNHPVHPFLVHLPVGLLVTSLLFDIIALAAGMRVFAGARSGRWSSEQGLPWSRRFQA